jgi:hypothetical protein
MRYAFHLFKVSTHIRRKPNSRLDVNPAFDGRDLLTEAVKIRQGSGAEVIELEPGHRHFLEERMSAVLLACPGPVGHRSSLAINNAGHRYDWDRLMFTFYTHHSEDISPCIL